MFALIDQNKARMVQSTNKQMTIQESVSSPIATGGGGTFFEQHVGAQFLALLLVGGIPPIIKDCQVEEVHFQTEHLGWHTDDLLIVASRGVGGRRQLAMQVKRRFTISSKNSECKKTFTDFWKDFKSPDRFDQENDRFALVTLRGTDTLLNSFNSLLDCSHASIDGTDFTRRLMTDGYLSKPAKEYAAVIREIIDEIEGGTTSDDDFWRFLRVLHVVSFDLNTPTAQNEAWIKTLLVHTTHDPDPVAAADATWRELLEIAGTGMPTAASYFRDNLPESLRNRHSVVSSGERVALQSLAAHSETTLDSIHTSIGNIATIHRDALVVQLLELLDEIQVVVVAGPAGSGKSALAKSAIQLLCDDLPCLAFRAEEFATSHIDQTLQQAQIPINAKQLLALFAAQGRKVIIVDSVERLLEAAVRDAFSDLLHLAKADKCLQLVMTCRDYSIDTVRTSLLDHAGLSYRVFEVPRLTDDELAQVVQSIPVLGRAIEVGNLKELLRFPYLLDKAAKMDWSDAGALPINERTFREKCWREVIRCDAVASSGLPIRRERLFLELARRRACELRPYVPCNDLDAEALDALRKDDLVVMSKETNAMAAPAHDVLEDWAIIQWLGGQFYLHEEETRAFADDIGGFPAVRRGYRKWLSEMLECETERTEAFVLSVFNDESLPAYFRDDTLICTLQSSFSQSFLSRNILALFADEARLLVRVIHLLRVACKMPSIWLPSDMAIISQLLVPKGDAWTSVLEIVCTGLDRLLPAHVGLVLGFVEDWARSVDWKTPEPPGFTEAGKIAYALLPHLDGYRMDGQRKRALEIIAKIPRADSVEFNNLLERGYTSDRDDNAATELAEILLTGISSSYACRFFPQQIVRLAMTQFYITDEELREGHKDYHSSIDIEKYFGIREGIRHDFFPASAIHGPFYSLLRSHPNIGVPFILALSNHAGSWYGEQRWPYDPLEPAWQLSFEIPGECKITQWANSRLWCLYRGLSVGPYVLQSALMALESWLLEICKFPKVDLEGWLLNLLRDSNNVAITAVVASVCNACPDKGGRAALALLTSRDLIELDRARMASECGQSFIPDFFPSFNSENKFYEDERKKSDSLSHRRLDLENLAVKLQISGRHEEVGKILDSHRAELPPVEEQDEQYRLWRLALHRMDVRGFRPIEVDSAPEDNDASSEGDSEVSRSIYYGPGEIEADVQEIIDRHTPIRLLQERSLSLLLWGRSAWEKNWSDRCNIIEWNTKLEEAKEHYCQELELEEFSRGGPGFVAAVCVRDCWEKMIPEDREWCIQVLIDELERNCDSDDHTIRHSKGSFRPDRCAAFVLPRVLSESTPENSDPRIIEAIAKALTHSVSEVVAHAAHGVGYYLHGAWMDFTMQCVGAVAWESILIDELRNEQKKKPYEEQLRGYELIRSVIGEVRHSIVTGRIDVQSQLAQLDLFEWPSHEAARIILQILGFCSHSEVAKQFYARSALALVECWTAERKDRGKRGRNRDHQFESDCSQMLARFLLKLKAADALALCEPFLVSVADCPRDTSGFFRLLIVEEDRSLGVTVFWEIWQAFADRLCSTSWVERVNSDYLAGKELLDILFLGIAWKDGVRHWTRLEGNTYRIDELVARLPSGVTVIGAYCRFLYNIGEQSLPNGFILIAERLRAGNSGDILADSTTVYYLESLLRRYVYGEPLRLKSNQHIRAGVLQILDQLVDAGSSAAYRMRDDFVTPMPVQS